MLCNKKKVGGLAFGDNPLYLHRLSSHSLAPVALSQCPSSKSVHAFLRGKASTTGTKSLLSQWKQEDCTAPITAPKT